MSAVCPNGHTSDETDYCSVCGASMAATKGSAETVCPACGTPRATADARYCEVCRYDFVARQPGPPPSGPLPPASGAAADPAPVVGEAPSLRRRARGAGSVSPADPIRWDVTIAVDPSLDVEPDPGSPPPTDLGERSFVVDKPEMLVGRRDDAHGVIPEIAVVDPAVSRRHAKLISLADGGLAVVDLASANGTAVNGSAVPAGERHTLSDGDCITMGRWTRITVRRRSA
jgi:predicted RNA-binding Zn-ribbon protein involved in translation (DUF1610 family)